MEHVTKAIITHGTCIMETSLIEISFDNIKKIENKCILRTHIDAHANIIYEEGFTPLQEQTSSWCSLT